MAIFERISEKAQLLLLSLYLGQQCNCKEEDSFFKEKIELLDIGYAVTDPHGNMQYTKKGGAYCKASNYTGVNFKRIVRNNSTDGNVALACEVLKGLSKAKSISRLSQTLPRHIRKNLLYFIND